MITQRKFDEAFDVAEHATVILFQHAQYNSGIDIFNMMLTDYQKQNIAGTEVSVGKCSSHDG